MRLWHYKLIPVLPKAQLISQWRECIAIKRQWEKGTLKHRLVSYVMNYNKDSFLQYVYELCEEMNKRNIKWNEKYYDEIYKFVNTNLLEFNNIYYPEHNDRYLVQCYYNLQEKYDRGLISKEEWNSVRGLVNINYVVMNDTCFKLI